MTHTTNGRWEREQARRHCLLHHVKQHLSDSEIVTATDAFSDLLTDADEGVVEELLLPIFNLSDFWPKRLATEILGLPTDEEYDWEELVDAFEARERQDRPNWLKEGF